MIIMSVADSTFVSLNEVATVIWQSADGKTSLGELVVQTVCRQFEVGSETAILDARDFAEELSRHAILAFSSQPISDAAAGEAKAELASTSSRRKPYLKPAFRYERVFETLALSCGKVSPNQFQCRFNRKSS